MSDDKKKKKKPDYEVGYCKPPKHSQFKKGQSGNSKGRTKGSRNWRTVLSDELDETVEVKVNGKIRTLSKRNLIVLNFVTRASKGDPRATDRMIELEFGEVANTNDRLTETPLTPEQEEQLARVLKRKRK